MKHHCHALGCEATVPPKMFMCRKHWFALPKRLRDKIWKHYRPGQEQDKKPTPEYLAAARECKVYLLQKAVDELQARNRKKTNHRGTEDAERKS